MAAPPSSASPDPSAAAPPPPSSSANPAPLRPYISSMISPLLPLSPHFSHSQSILVRPPNLPPASPHDVLYPIGAPTARGFPPRPAAVVARAHAGDHHVVTVANPVGFIRNNAPTAVHARPLEFPADHAAAQMYLHQRQQQQQGVVHQGRPLQQPRQEQLGCPQFVIPRPVGGGGVSVALTPDSVAAVVAAHAFKGGTVAAVHSKVTSFQALSSNAEFSNFKDMRDKSRDNDLVLVSNRKVRLSESPSGSLYALCRSWVWNRLPQGIQPNVGDSIKLLPRPLPLQADEPPLEKSAIDVEDTDLEKENADSVDELSADDLLKRHIKRAKRVRARLKEEHLWRIERYKQRLSVLLPLAVEQGRSDAAPGS